MKEIRPDVFVEDRYSTAESYRGCNYGYVATSEGLVVIDTPEFPADAVAFRDDLRDRGEVRFVLNTHEHFDHVAGNHYVPGTVVSHETVREALTGPPDPDEAKTMVALLFDGETAREKQATIDEMADGDLDWETLVRLIMADLNPESLQYLDDYRMVAPTVTFRDEATLHVGDTTFRLLCLPGHTESHVCVYVPEKEVLFAGDNVTTGCYPSMSLSRPFDWIESLEFMEDLAVESVVPGHGEVGEPAELPAFRSFLETCIERVQRGIDDGRSEAELVETVSFPEGRPPLHPVDASHRHDVERLYEALS